MPLLTRTVPLVALARRLGVIRFASTISTRSSNATTPPLPPQEAPQLSGGSFAVPPPVAASSYPLARLSTTSLLRAMLLHSITASPVLYKLGTKLLMTNLDSLKEGSLMKWGVDKTFYTQFCAGSTPAEITATISELRSLGLGIILAYAREAEITDTAGPSESQSQQIEQWLSGSLKTIACVEPGDFVAIKYSGAGLSSLPLLSRRAPCDESHGVGAALHEICKSAMAKGVRILIDAEQASVQDGVHDWTLELMRRYNRGTNDTKAVVYNTYQMYLKASPQILCRHIEQSRRENFTLGVKLVRGAYLHTDPRHLIHDTKEDTDHAYDDTIRLLVTGSPTPEPARASFYDEPMVHLLPEGIGKADLVVASHNRESIELALDLRRQELALDLEHREWVLNLKHQGWVLSVRRWPGELINDPDESTPGAGVGELTFAQLMGMADELSLDLLSKSDGQNIKVYKYAVWGTTQECVKYLVRRAEENKDAVSRTSENMAACIKEIRKRIMGFAGA